MSYPLDDFRIENENLILLWFSNGTSARVAHADLAKYLSKPDLAKVDKAMSQRRTFIKKVLPPTAIVLLSAGTIAVGAQDAQQLMNRLQSPQPPAQEHLQVTQPVSDPVEPAAHPGFNLQTKSAPVSQSGNAPSGGAANLNLPLPAAQAHLKNGVSLPGPAQPSRQMLNQSASKHLK